MCVFTNYFPSFFKSIRFIKNEGKWERWKQRHFVNDRRQSFILTNYISKTISPWTDLAVFLFLFSIFFCEWSSSIITSILQQSVELRIPLFVHNHSSSAIPMWNVNDTTSNKHNLYYPCVFFLPFHSRSLNCVNHTNCIAS